VRTARKRSCGEDLRIGGRVRELRTAAGLSQQVLADLINVTYQQVRNYEAGETRITAARLYSITQALKVDFAGFFEGLSMPERQAPAPEQHLFLDLAQNFRAIRDVKHREAICLLTRLLAGSADSLDQLDVALDDSTLADPLACSVQCS
jgi:transcriptional regulator with XRE-family HTH domain